MSMYGPGAPSESLVWTPPPLESLNFSSDCAAVGDFYQAWFSSLNKGDYYNWKLNITFYVAQALPANIIERYFRGALPKGLDPVPSYGQILEWEHVLRQNYSETVASLQLPGINSSLLSAHFSYFDALIEQPGRACWKSACENGFSWDRLGDINGPGMTATYYLQAILATTFCVIILFNAFPDSSYYPISEAAIRSKEASIKRSAKLAIQKTIRGFQDTSVMFAFALGPATGILQGPSFHVKDSAIAIYVLLLSLAVSFWLVTIRRCMRHIAHDGPDEEYTMPEYMSSWRYRHEDVICILCVVSWILTTMLVFLWRDITNPDYFDAFQNSICNFQATDRRLAMWIILSAMMFFSFVRWALVAWLSRDAAKRYKTLTKCLDLADMFLWTCLTWAILICYQIYKNHIWAYFNSDTWRASFNLGQALALASILPVFVYFAGPFYLLFLVKCGCAKKRSTRQELREARRVPGRT